MTSIQEINSTIMFGNISNEQLDSIVMAVKYRRGQLTREIKRSISTGDRVKSVSYTHLTLPTKA